MIDRIDNMLIALYKRPEILIGITTIPVLLGFGLYLLAPKAGQDDVFYLPLLNAHRLGLILAVIGMTLGLIFYAQHHPPLRSLLVIGFVGALVFGAMQVISDNEFTDIRHQQSERIGGTVYHLGYNRDFLPAGEDIFAMQTYTVYRCDTLGIFCEAIGRDIVPSLNRPGGFQNLAIMEAADGMVQVVDGGNQDLLFEYAP